MAIDKGFDFSDVAEVEYTLHVECRKDAESHCSHIELEELKTLSRSSVIDHCVQAWLMQSLGLKMTGASIEEGIDNTRVAFAATFYHGALYAWHKLQALELEKLVKMETKRNDDQPGDPS